MARRPPPARKRQIREKDANIQQVPVRVHTNDHRALKKLFIDEQWSFQKFFVACMELYFKRDPLFIKVIDDWREENDAPKKTTEKYTHSRREANSLLDEIAGKED